MKSPATTKNQGRGTLRSNTSYEYATILQPKICLNEEEFDDNNYESTDETVFYPPLQNSQNS